MPLSGAEKMCRYRQRQKADTDKYSKYLNSESARWKKRKEEGKISSAATRSARETRYIRKAWRERYQNNKKKAQEALVPISPQPILTTPTSSSSLMSVSSRQKVHGRRKKRKDRAEAYRKIRELEAKLVAEKKKSERYRKAFGRIKVANRNCDQTQTECTPRKQAKRKLLSPVKSIRKQLVFHYSLLHDLRQRITSCRTPAEKQLAHKMFVAGSLMRKYRLMTQAKKHLGLSVKGISYARRKAAQFVPTAKSGYKNKLPEDIAIAVQRFLEQDDVSRMCAGKKETITKSKVKRQKRYLLDNMTNLHKKFICANPGLNVSLSAFFKLRPFWVKKPRVQDRETCLCKVHENAKLLHDRLVRIDAVPEHGTLKETLDRTVCDARSRKCMYGACQLCKNRDSALFDAASENLAESKSEKTFWYQWSNVKETLDDGKQIRKTQKLRIDGSVDELKTSFLKSLSDLKPHEFRVCHQFKVLHDKRNDLKTNEAYLHIDFAENWTTKSLDEIQSAHFGASLRQIILHTGIMYVDGQTTSFCTVSDQFSHGPRAIWSHLMPVLKKIRLQWPHVDTLHFQSDGPTTQYRNRMNFCLTATVPKLLGFTAVWWNFSEAGHGKGPADGVGAAVKRLADGFVLSGKAIQNAADLVHHISESSTKMTVFYIENLEINLPENVPGFPGTMKIHQMLARECQIKYREFSCYCREDDFCECFEWKYVNYIGSRDEATSTKDSSGAAGSCDGSPNLSSTHGDTDVAPIAADSRDAVDLSAAVESPDASGDIVNMATVRNSHDDVDVAAAEEVACSYAQTASTYVELESELDGCESDLLILNQSDLQWIESEGIAIDCSGLDNQSGDGNTDLPAEIGDITDAVDCSGLDNQSGDGNTDLPAVAAKDCEAKPITVVSFYGMFYQFLLYVCVLLVYVVSLLLCAELVFQCVGIVTEP